MSALLAAGSVVAGRYEVRQHTGDAPGHEGYRARDRDADVEVSLWRIHDDLLPDAERRARFVSAAAELRALGHQHLLKIYDAGQEGGRAFVTAQPSAADAMLAPVRPETANDIDLLHHATCIAQGLEAAHAAGIVHGRLCPPLILRVGELIKVGGAGLYRDLDPDAAQRRWRPWRHYLAPELDRGMALGPSADIYSLAALVTHLAAGSGGQDPRALLTAVGARNPDLYRALDRALDEVPERRPGSAAEFLAQLDAALAGDLVPTREAHRALTDATMHYLHAAVPGDPTDFPDDEIIAPPVTDLDGEQDATRSLRPVRPRTGDEFADEETVAELASEPRGAPPPPVASRAARPKFVSMKPATLPGQKREAVVAPIDRPELQPRVRAISDVRKPVARPGGNYAPPRNAGAPAAGSRRRGWLVAAGAAALAVVAVAVVIWVAARGGGASGQVAPAPDAAPQAETPAPLPVILGADAAAEAEQCPEVMVEVEADPRFCIDRFESPGEGRLPETGMSLEQARRSCVRRGARLCQPGEWEQACRGQGGASWPYGEAHRPGTCNTGSRGAITAAGVFAGCASAAGARDMSGNVAEWVEGGRTRGGSALDRGDGRCSRDRVREPDRGYSDVGYRCCASLARPTP